MVCYLLFAVARDAHSTHTAHLPTWKPLRDEPSGTQDCSLLLLAEDLVELLAVEVELAAKDLLVNRELAGTGHREVAQDEHVHGRKLEVVRVRLRDAKREVLDARVEQVETTAVIIVADIAAAVGRANRPMDSRPAPAICVAAADRVQNCGGPGRKPKNLATTLAEKPSTFWILSKPM